MTDTAKVSNESIAGKYLTFKLDGEEYGVEILKVKEIIGLMNITKLPRTPEFVKGVINLRGKVIPVLDLRLKFGIEKKEYDEKTSIIVVEIENKGNRSLIGVIVDSVSEVLNVLPEDVESTPKFGIDLDTSFILGMAKGNNTVRTMLDIDKVLVTDEIIQLIDSEVQTCKTL
ncbi:chemotaxis protein CheW [Candidatus Latescibacterota bacterium]